MSKLILNRILAIGLDYLIIMVLLPFVWKD